MMFTSKQSYLSRAVNPHSLIVLALNSVRLVGVLKELLRIPNALCLSRAAILHFVTGLVVKIVRLFEVLTEVLRIRDALFAVSMTDRTMQRIKYFSIVFTGKSCKNCLFEPYT